MSRTKAESEKIKAGEKINRIFIGNGRIWEPKELQELTEEEKDDLPF